MIAFLTLFLVLPALASAGSYLIITGVQFDLVRRWRYLFGMAMVVSGIGLFAISGGRVEVASIGMVLANARMLGIGLSHLLILAGVVTLALSLSRKKLTNREFYTPY